MRWFRRSEEYARPSEIRWTQLVPEVEAFLSGRYEMVAGRPGPMPGWVRFNVLAHGDLCSIRRLRRTVPIFADGFAVFAVEPTEQEWTSARRVLATELLEFVGSDAERLTRVQRSALVPLELELIEAEERKELTPLELVRSTRAALRSSIT